MKKITTDAIVSTRNHTGGIVIETGGQKVSTHATIQSINQFPSPVRSPKLNQEMNINI